MSVKAAHLPLSQPCSSRNTLRSLCCGRGINHYKGTKIAGFGKVRIAQRTCAVGAIEDLLLIALCPHMLWNSRPWDGPVGFPAAAELAGKGRGNSPGLEAANHEGSLLPKGVEIHFPLSLD